MRASTNAAASGGPEGGDLEAVLGAVPTAVTWGLPAEDVGRLVVGACLHLLAQRPDHRASEHVQLGRDAEVQRQVELLAGVHVAVDEAGQQGGQGWQETSTAPAGVGWR